MGGLSCELTIVLCRLQENFHALTRLDHNRAKASPHSHVLTPACSIPAAQTSTITAGYVRR